MLTETRKTHQLTDFKALTFDCYGTLIDWETGMFEALKPLIDRTGKAFTRDQVLEAHARHESAQQTETPAMIYSDLLTKVHERLTREWGVRPIPEESRAYGQSVRDWPAFVDSAQALQYLKKYYKLVILSNVDRASFKAQPGQAAGGVRPRLHRPGHRLLQAGPAQFRLHAPANWRRQASRSATSCTPPRACSTITCPPTRWAWPRPGSTAVPATGHRRHHAPRAACRTMISASPAWPRWPRPTWIRCGKPGNCARLSVPPLEPPRSTRRPGPGESPWPGRPSSTP